MSLEIIKNQINSFLNTSTPEVMAIRGKWGVGKTYFWKQILNEAQEKKSIKLDKYAYVSLFGINSLEAMKFSMFEQVINKELIGKEASIDTFKSNAENLIKSLGRKSVHIFQGIPIVKNFGSAINSISFLSLQKVLLCIDDFERKGDKLSAKDVLGLVSILKEQKNCKVVLILNDESFEGKSKDDYKLFREKCIDIELVFDPSAKDCSDIAITGKDSVSTILKEYVEKLGINNIRIIKKIERVGRLLEKSLVKFENGVLKQALHSLTLYSWCYFTNNDISPDINYLKNLGDMMLGFIEEDKEESDKEKQWKAILRKFDYINTDEFDLQIIKTVETGFINEQELLPAAEQLNKQIIETKSINTLRDAWRIYHDSFDDNEDTLVEEIKQSILKNAKFIDPSGLNTSIKLLRDLDRNDLADELIDHYIKTRKDEESLFDLTNYPFRDDISDPKLLAAFQEISNESKKKITLKEALDKISKKSGWSGEEERVLAEATSEEYYNVFKNEKGEHLSTYIDGCLQFGRFANASDTGKAIADGATKALEQIGKESRLNERRVSKYGVKIKRG